MLRLAGVGVEAEDEVTRMVERPQARAVVGLLEADV